MDAAVELVEAMAPPRGSANPVKPVYELYGELLLKLDRPAEAVEHFEIALVRMPRRPRALLGLARARAAIGDEAGAAQAYLTLTEVWAGRESFEGVREALQFLGEPTN
jgi:hypothetical protein